MDFDIDKAYTMMYSLDRTGKIAGNIFTDYSSPETIQSSLNLPPAQYYFQAKGKHSLNELLPTIQRMLIDYVSPKDQNDPIYKENERKVLEKLRTLNDIAHYIEDIVNYGVESDDQIRIFKYNAQKYGFIELIINKINDLYKNGVTDEEKYEGYTGYFNLSEDLSEIQAEDFKQLFSAYAQEGKNSGKNRIVQGIVSQAESLLNLEASQQPMEMAPVTDVISKIRKQYGFNDDGIEYNEYDIYTRFLIQRANSVGKVDVGISANGIKAAGALQQYYNTIFAGNMDNPNLYGFKKGSLNIHIQGVSTDGKPGKEIINQKFYKIANTKVPSLEKFAKLFNIAHKNEYGEVDESTDQDYELFQKLKEGTISEEDRKNLTYHQNKFIDNFNTYVEHKGKRSVKNLSLMEFQYYCLQFEDNVADLISIFISMSTDNAKELALAKIHATPELLSMPLAMITLGMDIDSVIEVCVNVFDAIHKEMSKNRFESLSPIDVLDAISILEDNETITADTANSLRDIYNFAQELRSITRFFKVNQGVVTRYSDLKAFSTSLSNDKFRFAVNAIGEKKAIPDEIRDSLPQELKDLPYNELWKLLETPIDFYDLFQHEDIEKYKGLYDIGRTVVNVIDIVMQSPHFKQQLRGTSEILKFIESNSGKAKLAVSLLENSMLTIEDIEDRKLEGDKKEAEQSIDDTPKKNSNQSFIRWEKLKSQTNLEQLYSKTLRLIDNWVIGQFIMRNPELRFDIQNLHKTYPSSILSELGAKTVLRLDSEFGLNTFIKFINEAFIPQLQETYAKQHNFFLENLVMKSHHRNDKLQYWDLKFDPYALKDNPVLGHNFNTAAKDFEKIADIPSGILAPNGTNLTIGEVFYLYNVITSKGLTTGLGTIAHSSGENKNVFPISKDDIYRELDQKAQLLNGEVKYRREYERLSNIKIEDLTKEQILRKDYVAKLLAQIESTKIYFRNITEQLTFYAQALVDDNNSTTLQIDGRYYGLNLNDSFIETFAQLKPGNITVSSYNSTRNTSGISGLADLEQTIKDLSLNTDIQVIPKCTVTRAPRTRGVDFYLKVELTFKSLADNKSITLPSQDFYLGFASNQDTPLVILQDFIDNFVVSIKESMADAKMFLFSYDLDRDMANTLNAINDDSYTFIDSDVVDFVKQEIPVQSEVKGLEENINSLLKNIQSFIGEQTTIYRSKYGVPRIRKVGDKQILIIPNNTSMNMNQIIDLYLETKLDNDYTLNSKLLTLLQELYPDATINQNTVYNFVKENKKELKEKLPKFLQKYIEDLADRSLQTGYFKSRVRSKLLEFSKSVNNEKLCYYTLSEEDMDNAKSLSVGDIVYNNNNNALYLYIGDNEYGERELILISRGVSFSSSINDNPWTIQSEKLPIYIHVDEVLGNDDFVLYKKLITTPNFDLQDKQFPSEEEIKSYKEQEATLLNVKVGDIIDNFQDKQWVVINKIESFIDILENGEKKHVLRLSLKNKQGKVIIVSCDDVDMSNENANNGYYRTKGSTITFKMTDKYKIKSQDYNFNISENISKIDFQNLPKSVKLQLLNQCSDPDYVVIKQGNSTRNSYIRQIINNDFVQLLDNSIIEISDIIELHIEMNRDPDLVSITKNRAINIIQDTEKSIDARESSFDSSNDTEVQENINVFDDYRPEDLEGVWVQKINRIKNQLIPCKFIAKKGTEVIGIPKVYLDDYYKIDTANLEVSQLLREGDIIYTEIINPDSLSNSSIVIRKVLYCKWDEKNHRFDVITETITKNVTSSIRQELDTKESVTVESSSYTQEELRKAKIYSKQQRVPYQRNKVTTTDNRAKAFIRFLEMRTGLKVVEVNAGTDSWSARINNNVIEINRDKVKNDEDLLKESIHEFIHVVLGNLRLHNPTTYYEIMNRYKQILPEVDNNEEIYSSDLEKIEESLVRKATENAMKLISDVNNPNQTLLDSIFKSLDEEVSKFFGQNISGENLNKSIDNLMSRTNIFKAQLGNLDLIGLRNRSVRLDILSKVTKECN